MLPSLSAPVRVFLKYSDLTNLNYKDLILNFGGDSNFAITNPYCFIREHSDYGYYSEIPISCSSSSGVWTFSSSVYENNIKSDILYEFVVRNLFTSSLTSLGLPSSFISVTSTF